MKKVTYYIARPFLFIIGNLPSGLLYALSSLLAFLLGTCLTYRKKVIRTNLQQAFPEKNENEVRQLEYAYYRYLSDLILETIQSFYLSKEEITLRCTYDNPFRAYMQQGKSCMVMLSHMGNWEWANLYMGAHSPYKLVVVYKKLSNSYFDIFMQNKRARLGSIMVEMNDVYKFMLAHRNEQVFYVFLCDQTPHPEQAYWTNFFNRETPFLRGGALLAKRMDMPVIYGTMRRPARGCYHITTECILPDTRHVSEAEIIELYVRKLEKDIRAQPEIWLWSHKRWKHKKV